MRPTLAETFSRCRARKRKALIPYLTAGFPDQQLFLDLLAAYVRAGADIIEVGIPFSDPLADGPAIQFSSQRALDNGVTLGNTLELLHANNGTAGTPLVIMSYYNPIHAYGPARFVRKAKAAGIAGVLIPDLIPDEDDEIARRCREAGLDMIYLVAPTTTPARRKSIIAQSRGFVYLVSVTGTTGARAKLPRQLAGWIRQVKSNSSLPVCVGFGISNPRQARAVARHADGVIIGSAIIDLIRAENSPRKIVARTETFLRQIRKGIDHDQIV